VASAGPIGFGCLKGPTRQAGSPIGRNEEIFIPTLNQSNAFKVSITKLVLFNSGEPC